MPGETNRLLAVVATDRPDQDTFSAGAAIVRDRQYHWRGVYLQHVANRGTA